MDRAWMSNSCPGSLLLLHICVSISLRLKRGEETDVPKVLPHAVPAPCWLRPLSVCVMEGDVGSASQATVTGAESKVGPPTRCPPSRSVLRIRGLQPANCTVPLFAGRWGQSLSHTLMRHLFTHLTQIQQDWHLLSVDTGGTR